MIKYKLRDRSKVKPPRSGLVRMFFDINGVPFQQASDGTLTPLGQGTFVEGDTYVTNQTFVSTDPSTVTPPDGQAAIVIYQNTVYIVNSDGGQARLGELRRDTAANWTSSNPTLTLSQFGYETDTRKLKVGDGATTWNSLGYVSAILPDGDHGDVSSSSGTITIDNNVVTYAKMQDVSATNRILGRITAGAGDVEELTGANARTIVLPATTGNALKVLRVNSGATDYELASVNADTSGAGWTLVASQNCASAPAANFDFTGLGSYNELLIHLVGVGASGAGAARVIRVSVDNGSTFYSASGDYLKLSAAGTTTSQGSAGFTTPASSAAQWFSLQIRNMKGAKKLCLSEQGNVLFDASASDINAVRVTSNSADTLNSGTIYVYAR